VKTHRVLRVEAAEIWAEALRAVDPESAVRKTLRFSRGKLEIHRCRFDLGKFRKLWVLGAGKAAAPMGRAVEKLLGRHVAGGICVTKYGHGLALERLEVIEAGHPLPDRNSMAAGARMLSLVKTRVGPDDLVLCLLSGGASALLVSPVQGITLKDKLACTRLLHNSGASIGELNAIRKHLSRLKGGGLARLLAPARVVSLILSDVVGDDVQTIASGLVAPDPTTFGDCIGILRRLQLWERVPLAVRRRFTLGAAGQAEETLKEGDPAFRRSRTWIVGNNAEACTAAAQAARRLGYHAMILTSRLEGDNADAARFHMSVAGEIIWQRRPVRRPACIISGGETTVKILGRGTGGRNQEFVLHCVRPLADLPAPCVVASLGTDGTDGPTDAAGAIADNATLVRSLKFGSHFLSESLDANDSHAFFKRLGDLILTGPTRTNVMDLHLVLVG
jgi:glycerate-2-kinase